jgi:hypothetical protein
MARGKSVRLLASIPAKYRPDFIERVDKRTVLGKAVHNRYHAIVADLGGEEALSTIKRSHVRRLVTLETMIEGIECYALAGVPVDAGSWTQLLNSWLGIARALGLERQARPIERLRDVMRADEPEPAAAAEASGDDRREADVMASPEEIAAEAPSAEAAL